MHRVQNHPGPKSFPVTFLIGVGIIRFFFDVVILFYNKERKKEIKVIWSWFIRFTGCPATVLHSEEGIARAVVGSWLLCIFSLLGAQWLCCLVACLFLSSVVQCIWPAIEIRSNGKVLKTIPCLANKVLPALQEYAVITDKGLPWIAIAYSPWLEMALGSVVWV